MKKLFRDVISWALAFALTAPLAYFGPNLLGLNPFVQPTQAAAPIFQAFGDAASDAAISGDITVTLPAHATDDILLVLVWVRSNVETIPNPTGWTAISGTPFDRGTTSRYWMWWKRAASASETNPLIDTDGTTANIYGDAIVYRGAITTGDPWQVVGSASTGTTDPTTITGITSLSPNSLIVVPVGGEDNNNASIITTGTDPAAYAEHYSESATGTDGAITFSEAARTTAGATGDVSVNWNVAVPIGWGGKVLALVPPLNIQQFAYRWRNDDGSETTGTNLVDQNTALTGMLRNTNYRLRFTIYNSEGPNASSYTYRLDWASRVGASCDTDETYAAVPVSANSDPFEMTTTTNYTDQTASTNVSTGPGVMTDPSGGTFTAGYLLEDPSNQTPALTLNSNNFTEIEYNFIADTDATFSGNYCLRLSNAGTALNTYTNYAAVQIEAAPGPTTDQVMRHGNWFDAGVEQGFFWAN